MSPRAAGMTGGLLPERLGHRLCRGRRAGLAQLAQVERAEDDAQQPELQGKLLAKGGWDYELVDALQPQPGDIVVPKPRYSGFFNTQLDSVLRARGIRNLVFMRHRHQCLRRDRRCATASTSNISA